MDNLHPIGDLARAAGLKIDTLRKRCQRSQFDSAVKLANRWFISQGEFEEYVEEVRAKDDQIHEGSAKDRSRIFSEKVR